MIGSLFRGAVLFVAFATTGFAELERYQFSEPHMGTMVRITTFAPNAETATAAADKAFERIAELNAILSDYDPESELSQLSRQVPGIPQKLSEELFSVLWRAQEISAISDGAFDVTVGAVGQLWREARKSGKLPEEAVVCQLLESTGYEKIDLKPNCQTATLKMAGLRLDLGGIAKGYAATQALAVMREHGLPRSLVAVSGDLAIGDPPPGRKGWKTGISSFNSSKIERKLLLQNVSVSTSGDVEQFVEIDGIRYSHILDPRTGIGLKQRIAVTTIATDGATADALATAMSVLGVKEGLPIIESIDGAEAFFLIVTPNGKEAIASSRFPVER